MTGRSLTSGSCGSELTRCAVPGELRSRWDTLAIPLADVSGVEVPENAKPVTGGDTIRVFVRDRTVPGGRREYRGVFVKLAADSLSLEAKGGLRSVPIASIRRIDVVDGTHGHALTGLVMGLLIGGAGAAGVAAAAGEGSGDAAVPPEAMIAPVVLLGGVLVGALVGAASRSERWREVPLTKVRPSKQ